MDSTPHLDSRDAYWTLNGLVFAKLSATLSISLPGAGGTFEGH